VDYIEGIGGWRFLDNDSNRSVDQYTGIRTLSSDELKDWVSFLIDAHRNNYILMVAPAKEEVAPFLYPRKRAELTPIDQLLQLPEAKSILFPISELASQWSVTYGPLDTHWTDQGACIAAAAIARQLGAPTAALDSIPFAIFSREGDLGNKSTPPLASLGFHFKEPPRAKFLAFDNGVPNHGRVWIFENKDAPVNQRVAIFGDSFSINMAPALSNIYRRVFYAHSAAQPDQRILQMEKPDHVILQTNQRFITTPPKANCDLLETIEAKLAQFDEAARKEILARLIHRENSITSNFLAHKVRELHESLGQREG